MTYEEFFKLIRLNIKKLRIEKFPDYSFNAIGHEAKMRGSDWENIELGKKVPTLPTLSKIANALEVEIDELFQFGNSKIERQKLISALEVSNWDLNGAAEQVGMEVSEIRNITAEIEFRRDDPEIKTDLD
jgi:transcriptional regulator with XRE-family HTH domain